MSEVVNSAENRSEGTIYLEQRRAERGNLVAAYCAALLRGDDIASELAINVGMPRSLDEEQQIVEAGGHYYGIM